MKKIILWIAIASSSCFAATTTTPHGGLVGPNIHVPYNWTYANNAAMLAATGFVTGDVGKLALESDNNTLWMLTALTPTWAAVSAAAGTLAGDVTGSIGANTVANVNASVLATGSTSVTLASAGSSANSGSAITISPGSATGANHDGGRLTVNAGSSGSRNGGPVQINGGSGFANGGNVTIIGGTASASTGGLVTLLGGISNGGATGGVNIDSGSNGGAATSFGSLNIGGVLATTINIGNAGSTTTITGTFSTPSLTGLQNFTFATTGDFDGGAKLTLVGDATISLGADNGLVLADRPLSTTNVANVGVLQSAGGISTGAHLGSSGLITFNGATSGTPSLKCADVAGTASLTLPTSNGTNHYVMQTDGSGALSFVDGSNISGLNGSNISSGTVADARLSANVPIMTSNVLPVASGINLTALNAGSLGSGTAPTARLGTGTANSGSVLYGDQTYKALNSASVGLGSVENTALSTWAGTSNITTLGTIGTGVWSGTTIVVGKGGTGTGTFTAGGVILGNGVNALSQTAAPTAGQILLGNTTPAWTPTSVSGDITIGSTGITAIGAAKVTNAMLAGSITAANLVGSDIATVGTITTGTWSGTTIAVAKGGTNLANGTSGGVLGYTASGTIASSAVLAANGIVVGGGAGATPTATAAGTNNQALFGVTGSAPTMRAITAADVPAMPQFFGNNSTFQTLSNNTALPYHCDTLASSSDILHFSSDAALTGTLAKNGTTAVVGTSTLFTSELSVGQVILIPGTANEVRVVTVITDNTHLTVGSAFVNTSSGQTGTRQSAYYVANTAGVYHVSAVTQYAYIASAGRHDTTFLYNPLTTSGSDGTGFCYTTTQCVVDATNTPVQNHNSSGNVKMNQYDMFTIMGSTKTSGAGTNITQLILAQVIMVSK